MKVNDSFAAARVGYFANVLDGVPRGEPLLAKVHHAHDPEFRQ